MGNSRALLSGWSPQPPLLLNQGKVEEGQAAWEYAQLPPSTPGFFRTHTYFMFVLRQHKGNKWQRKCV